MLDVEHDIASRTGLQCAPLIHEQMGTAPRGTVRLSVGPLNEVGDADAAVEAFERIAVHAL
jgi:selenocysteine lyase/cysteine desulfurase